MTDNVTDWIEARTQDMEPLLMRLLYAPFVEFGKELRATLPAGPGIYAISRKDAPIGLALCRRGRALCRQLIRG